MHLLSWKLRSHKTRAPSYKFGKKEGEREGEGEGRKKSSPP
jgi:hypothetical protein